VGDAIEKRSSEQVSRTNEKTQIGWWGEVEREKGIRMWIKK
jgi:hypothetical protein